MILLNGVTKLYGAKKAVDNVDLKVESGELFAFLGPNGAGKTTTMKMICGLLQPSVGVVKIGGWPAGSPESRRLLAYVPDSPYVYDKLTGREFLRFVVDMYGVDHEEGTAKIEELVDIFEMNDYIDQLCESYSHGMKQRVVFASALVHEPQVLVVDEPLVGLDPRSARIVKNMFLTQARSGVAVLMSTHLLSVAEELADTIGIMNQGRMLAKGTLKELREVMAMQHGPLEEMFLKLTGGDKPLSENIRSSRSGQARSGTSTSSTASIASVRSTTSGSHPSVRPPTQYGFTTPSRSTNLGFSTVNSAQTSPANPTTVSSSATTVSPMSSVIKMRSQPPSGSAPLSSPASQPQVPALNIEDIAAAALDNTLS